MRQDIIDACLVDRFSAWEMRADGRYELLGSQTESRYPPHVIADPGSKMEKAVRVGFQQAIMDVVMREVRLGGQFFFSSPLRKPSVS